MMSMDREDSHPFETLLSSPKSPTQCSCLTPSSGEMASPSDDWTVRFSEQHTSRSPLVEPRAPRRRNGRQWFGAMLNNDAERFLTQINHEDSDDLNTEIFVEWLRWAPGQVDGLHVPSADKESVGEAHVVSSEFVWVFPLLIAARWSSPMIVSIMLKHGAFIGALNNLGGNALSCLCSQPRPSTRNVHSLEGFWKPDVMRMAANSFPELSGMSYSADKTLLTNSFNQTFAQMMEFRCREMALVARVLISYGCDPAKSDQSGRTPFDYAVLFGHAELIQVLNSFATDPDLLCLSRLHIRPASDSRRPPHLTPSQCCTPERRLRSTTKSLTGNDAAVRTPFKTPCDRGGDQGCSMESPTCGTCVSMVSLASAFPTGYGLSPRRTKKKGSRLSKVPGKSKRPLKSKAGCMHQDNSTAMPAIIEA